MATECVSKDSTNVAIVGCGYVFDHYMTTRNAHPELNFTGIYDIDTQRAIHVGEYYDLSVYDDFQSLLDDQTVELVLNLTSIESHYETTLALLKSGKNVYSEKPIASSMHETSALFEAAEKNSLMLSAAPCNLLCDSVQTIWKAVLDGAIGIPRLIYAEFDDNPIYLMKPEMWRSRTGAPWPYTHEYEQGCTIEHVGYHLAWMCAIFGPVESVTAFSKVITPDKTKESLSPPDTPDFSVACLNFKCGVVGRVTCSIAAPSDHRMRIIGNEGELTSNTYRHYQSPVNLERFSSLSLNARKARSVRIHPFIGSIFGVGGKRLKLVRHFKSQSTEANHVNKKTGIVRRIINTIKRREVGSQDKLLGPAYTALALRRGDPCPMPPEFLKHITELTLLIQNAGVSGSSSKLQTTFEPLKIPKAILDDTRNIRDEWRPSFLERKTERMIDNLHKH